MSISSLARIKCYTVLQGLERSLADNLIRNIGITNPQFFTEDEQRRALKRFQEDTREQSWEIDQLDPEDILEYLDLGDLLNLLNRHAGSVKNITPEDIRAASKTIVQSGTLTIRKRVMHPVRPLEIDDLPTLLKLGSDIQIVAPSLFWDPLKISMRRLAKVGSLFDTQIPEYWAEEPPIVHNLPAAEFDETGFIGRQQERKALKKLLESEHRVISVVGGGGIGKTALALRVCNDFLEQNEQLFDRIVWVSLKTKYLTAEGVKEIRDAIDSIELLIDVLQKRMIVELDEVSQVAVWDRVTEQMRSTRTLLVIDNLETIGAELRDLALSIPVGSKLLFTSRIGLGEIEIRYEIPNFAPRDATAMFRSLVAIHNYKSLKNLRQNIIDQYVQSLHSNPLLIKWFVHAVGMGTDPQILLSKEGLDEPLNFCYANIFRNLGALEQKILSIMLAARRELTNAQLLELTGSQQVPYIKACQELVRSSMVERVSKPDGTMVFQVRGLVYEYLSRHHPPEDLLVREVREKIQNWQIEQDKSAVQSAGYRYGISVLQVGKEDERISAQHLFRALQAMRSGEYESALTAIDAAEKITPMWWEIYRVRARLFQLQSRPIYEIEEAYEQSIKYSDNDVNRYHYAAYLIGICEYQRAIEQIERALEDANAQPLIFRSLRGLALMRMGQIDDAIDELKLVWDNRSSEIPIKIGRLQGTQLVDAYKRKIEQLMDRGNLPEAGNIFLLAADIVDEIHKDYYCDHKLAGLVIETVTPITNLTETNMEIANKIPGKAGRWDNNELFRRCAVESYKAREAFRRNQKLSELFPKTASALETSDFTVLYTGKIVKMMGYFGFIECEELGEVHFSQTSLKDRNYWNKIKPGLTVEFQVLPAEPKGLKRLPHAVQMKLL